MYINNLMCTLFNVCILISFATTRTLRNYRVKRYFLLPTCVSGYIRLWYHIHLFFSSNCSYVWYDTSKTHPLKWLIMQKLKLCFVTLLNRLHLTDLWMEAYNVAQATCGITLLRIASVRKVFKSDLFSQTWQLV